jgi:hypothetical protein
MTKIEKLRERMHQEEAVKAAKTAEKLRAAAEKAAAPKPAKPVKPVKPKKIAVRFVEPIAEPEHIEFNPNPTLMECIQRLTPAEAANPKWVATSVTLFIIDQIMRTDRQCAVLSDVMSDNLAWLTAEPFTEKPNLKRMLSTALLLADSIECRSQSEEGSGIRKLHELERALLQRQRGSDESRTRS